MLLQHAAGGWGLLVYLHLVPPLLKEVGSVVVSSIGVTKCNVFQVVAHQLALIISESSAVYNCQNRPDQYSRPMFSPATRLLCET